MPDYPFKNLIFEGGGVKGIAYTGAMEELDKREYYRIKEPVELRQEQSMLFYLH